MKKMILLAMIILPLCCLFSITMERPLVIDAYKFNDDSNVVENYTLSVSLPYQGDSSLVNGKKYDISSSLLSVEGNMVLEGAFKITVLTNSTKAVDVSLDMGPLKYVASDGTMFSVPVCYGLNGISASASTGSDGNQLKQSSKYFLCKFTPTLAVTSGNNSVSVGTYQKTDNFSSVEWNVRFSPTTNCIIYPATRSGNSNSYTYTPMTNYGQSSAYPKLKYTKTTINRVSYTLNETTWSGETLPSFKSSDYVSGSVSFNLKIEGTDYSQMRSNVEYVATIIIGITTVN